MAPTILKTLSPIIDRTGISAPSYVEILSSLKESYRQIYGQDVYLEPDSQDGQWIAVLALALFDANNATISAYNAYSPVTAQGNGLSNAVKLNGIRRKTANYSDVEVILVGQAGTRIRDGIVQSNDDKWLLPDDVLLPPEGQIEVTARAQSLGVITAAPGAITKILTPTRGWQSVTNPAAARPGSPVESDGELRMRQSFSTALAASSIVESIQGTVANLVGIREAALYENDTGNVDVLGLPPHSICLVALGGASQAIADAIALKKTPGTGTFGDTAIKTLDSKGMQSTIKFMRAKEIPIFVKIKLQPMAKYAASSEEKIRQDVSSYIDNIPIGAGNVFNKGLVDYWKVGSTASLMGSGIENTFMITALTMGQDGEAILPESVPVYFDEKPVCKPDFVSIEVVP